MADSFYYEKYRKEAIETLKELDVFVLECVVNLLKKPRAWKKGGEAFAVFEEEYKDDVGKIVRNKYVDETHPHDPEAFAFCLVGAIKRCDPEFQNLDEETRELIEGRIISFNDYKTTDKDKVLRAVKAAMKSKLEEKNAK